MGLTIHYTLSTDTTDLEAIYESVKEFRQLALQLPFQAIEEIVEFRDEEMNSNDKEDPHRWLKIQASHFLKDGNRYLSVAPVHVIAFTTVPGDGSEPANFGLARYPEVIDLFQGKKKRRVQTKLTGWRWASFCKTQYASDPQYGGVANFVRCHLAIVELLDRIQNRKLARVDVNDESDYWEHRDVRKLAEVVGEWNEMVAAVVGQFKDANSGQTIAAPITEFANFEHLEARGQDKFKKQ